MKRGNGRVEYSENGSSFTCSQWATRSSCLQQVDEYAECVIHFYPCFKRVMDTEPSVCTIVNNESVQLFSLLSLSDPFIIMNKVRFPLGTNDVFELPMWSSLPTIKPGFNPFCPSYG